MLLATLIGILLNANVAHADSFDFTSTTSIAAYAQYEAESHGVDSAAILGTLKCESGFKPDKPGDYDKVTGQYTSWGVAQIHLIDHPTVTMEQALDPQWAIDWMIVQFQAGHAHWWSGYKKWRTGLPCN